MRKNKTKTIKQAPKKVELANRTIDIGSLLCYRDDNYCEVLRPTYSLFHLIAFFVVFIIVFIACLFALLSERGAISDILFFALRLTMTVMVLAYLIMLLSKDFSAHLKQAYYQPIVFNRKQQKVYIYYNDSKIGVLEIVALDMADLVPVMDVAYHLVLPHNSKKGSKRHFFDVRLCVKDSRGRNYPLFHHFYSSYFCYNVQQEKRDLLESFENELAGYWNWCAAYMQYQDDLLPNSKITKHLFRARWPKEIRHQFKGDNSEA